MNEENFEILEIDSEKLKRMLMLHVRFLLFDLRSPAEYEAGHIKGAVNIPSQDFIQKASEMVPFKETPIVAYDQDGVKCREIISEFGRLGYLNIVSLEGGYSNYQ